MDPQVYVYKGVNMYMHPQVYVFKCVNMYIDRPGVYVPNVRDQWYNKILTKPKKNITIDLHYIYIIINGRYKTNKICIDLITWP